MPISAAPLCRHPGRRGACQGRGADQGSGRGGKSCRQHQGCQGMARGPAGAIRRSRGQFDCRRARPACPSQGLKTMAKLAAFVPSRRAVAEQRAGERQASPPRAADAGTSAAAGAGALWTFAWPGGSRKGGRRFDLCHTCKTLLAAHDRRDHTTVRGPRSPSAAPAGDVHAAGYEDVGTGHHPACRHVPRRRRRVAARAHLRLHRLDGKELCLGRTSPCRPAGSTCHAIRKAGAKSAY